MREDVKSEDRGVSRRQAIAAAQRQKEKNYWLEKLFGQTEPGVFPYDREIEVGRYCPDQVTVDLSEEIFLKLKALSSGSDHLLHMVLTAALGVLLKGYAHRDDLVVGTTVLRQADQVSFINTVLPLRLCVRQHMTFKQLLLQVQETLVEATENQNYPVQLLADQYPLFSTAVLLENLHDRQYLGDIEPDMIFSFLRTVSGISGQVEYNASLYEKATVERIAANFKQVLGQAVFNVDLAISEIEILTWEEKQRILYEFNAEEVEYPKEKSVPELFREQGGINPQSEAVVYRERKITYEVLDRGSARLAAMLGEMGVKPGVPAAVLLDWSVELIVAIMGILRAGGAYLPIDPRYPGKRIEAILNDSNAFVVVTSPDLAVKIGGFGGHVLELAGVMEEEYGQEETRSLCSCSPHDPAYIIYTSGSTGAPKGIVVEHHSFIDFVCWAVEEFEHQPGYQVLLSNSYASDGSIQQIFPPLVSGGTLHLLDPEVRAHPRDYYAYLKTNRINCIDEVPVVMNLLFNSLDLDETRELLPDLTSLSLGSEYVPIEVVRKCRKYLNHNGKIINAYGPAEASVETCTYHFDGRSETEISLIGKPRRNLQVYILDPQGNCCPIGVPGEICISGVGLARGYINNPELTAERFMSVPASSSSSSSSWGLRLAACGCRLYITGDQGRWLVDGNIEFLGRIDHQVQLRGFRVELGEIENQLLRHEQIKEAVVIEKPDPNGDKCLCAYIVTDKEDVEQLRTFLSEKLPDHMIPAYFMPIEKIPLTPNGKIDRKALPEPEFHIDAGGYIGPRDDIEKKLQDIWSEVLALAKEKISIHADFFHLGGHSLKATVMISRVHEVLHVKVPLAEVFRTSSIKELSGYIRRQGEDKFICIEPVEKKEYYVTSAAQKRMYIIQQMNQGIVYNTPDIIALEYEPDVKKLTETFKQLIRRHESLRTSFHMLEDRLVQRVHDDVEFEIERHTLAYGHPSQEGNTLAYRNPLSGLIGAPPGMPEGGGGLENFIRPFDLSQTPLLRVGLVKTAEKKHLLLVDIHHIITDGVSSIILERDFATLYNDMEETLSPLRIQYADFSEWQNSEKQKEKLKRQEEYWLKELAGDIPLLDLPTDFRRPDVFTFTGDTVLFEIDPEPTRLLKQVAKEEGVTLYLVMLTLFYVLLAKLSSQEDIVIGTGIFGRNHADLHHLIGMFLNMIPLRNYPRDHKSFREFLGEVKKRTLEAFENQDLPFDDLLTRLQVERQGHATPLFDVVFSLQEMELGPKIQAVQANEKTGFKRLEYDFITNTSKFDLTFNGMEIEGKFQMAVEYSTQLFKKERITRTIEYFKKTVTAVLENRDIRLSELDVLSEEEKWELLYEFNRTGTDYPADKTLHQLFEEQAEMRPDRIAVLFGEQQLTYRELNERAARLAGLLQKKGVKPNSIVGMMLERSLDMIIGILAVLKAGGAYLPLEPGTPQKRMLSMLEDCQAPVLLTTCAAATGYSFSTLQGLRLKKISPHRTAVRPQITDLDGLPLPDRSLVNYEKYHQYIGIAMAKHTIPILASRGCPYNCAYCHKIWPKKQIVRSAENVFAEVSRLYDIGVRRFVILDDIFNLNIKNSSRFYQLILDHGLDLHLFFPDGVRGDILTHEYIDLMIRAGTVNLMMALESASPRIQRLVGKNLNIERFRENLQYIVNQYPQVILETNIMMGFPTETEEEALMSLNFIKQHQWIDFPNLNILKIYAGTDMEHLAMKNGISREAIENSFNRAYHELPDTLPFDKNFVRKCQAELFNGYFLNKERLLAVLPHQMKVLSEDEMVQKYDSYIPVEIRSFDGLLDFFGIAQEELGITGPGAFLEEHTVAVPDFYEKVKAYSSVDGESNLIADGTAGSVLRVLLLDLSKTFSTETPMLYDVTESPLGLMYLLTYLNREFGGKIMGKIAHARMDFDNYRELKALIEEFRPDVIGLRTLTFYKDFYHQTASAIRQWGVEAPIIAGGPYASSDWAAVLQDPNIDLAVIGEGEITLAEIIGKMIENRGRLPGEEVLKDIPGIAFIPEKEKIPSRFARQLMMMDLLEETLETEPVGKVSRSSASTDLAYVIFTSGSTGKPKGTLTTHYNVVRVVRDTNYIDLQPQDRILQLSNYAFDGSVFDIYGALLNGAALVMMTGEQVLNLDRLSHLLKKECITVFFVTTALFNALVDLNIESFAHIRKVLFGGERVSVDHTRQALNAVGKGKILHMYGPTETTVYASFYSVDFIREHQETIPIGGPLANTTIYILDKNLNLVPLGVSGEICIGGQGNALGYLNNPELTAEKFNQDLWDFQDYHDEKKKENYQKFFGGSRGAIFQKSPPGLLYRTGDLGRWLAGGNIEFIGRLDQQVKIRGFRIEPGEIEKHLLQLDVIDQAVVIPREAKDGGRYLCAYVVLAGESRHNADPGELKVLLSHDLPDYMVPAHFVMLDKIPLTSNGKVDRRKLPDPEVSGQDAAYAAPRNPVEKKLAWIWSEILGIKKEIIGIDNDFFRLGGHSLRATILISRIHKEFHVEIPLAELFKSPFIRELATSIKNSTRARFSPIEPAEKKEYYKLSPAQERLYVLQQMVRDNVVYNVPQVVEIEGPLDKEKLAATFNKLLNHHESLRTSFHMVGKEPVQRIHTQVEFEIEYFSAEQRTEAAIQDFIRSFDLSLAPLLRVGLIHTPGDKHVLMVDMHHIITDGTSMPLFINESMALYAGEELPPLRLQYKDFAEWQHQEEQEKVIRRQESYWSSQFEGEIPVLNLPLDYPRPAVQSFAGAVVEFVLSPEQTFKLNELAAVQGATLYMVLLAVTTILFHKLTHQEDIVIGTPIAARRHVDLEGIIGMFVNTLAMRNYPAGSQTFSRFLDQVKENTLWAFENQEYPFEELVEKVVVSRDASRCPLFDAAFALQNIEMQTGRIPEAGIGDLSIKPYEMESTVSKFDLTLACAEVEQGLQCSFEYCTALFRQDTIERFSAYFSRIISAVANEPGIRLKQIEIISEEEKRHLLIDFNDTAAEYPQDKTIQELFAEQVERTPDSVALVGSWQLAVGKEERIEKPIQLTYMELNRKSNQLAHLLKEKGVLADDIVAIMMERSIEMIIGILGILKAGGAYLPIDPDYPEERKRYILADSSARTLLTNLSEGHHFHHSSNQFSTHHSGNLAYVIYTSGTTGKPKGTLVTHYNVTRVVRNTNYIQLNANDRILQLSNYAFDGSVFDIYGALLNGAALVMLEQEKVLTADQLAKVISNKQVTVFFVTTALFNALVDIKIDCFKNIRKVLFGGERVSVEHSRKALEYLGKDKIIHVYGPTETTVYASYYFINHIEENVSTIPIGKPISNTTAYILDNYLKPVPIGVHGELFIGGYGVSRGYLNNPELTAEKFVSASYKSYRSYRTYSSEKIYKTGDLVRWLLDGNIEFLGRIDSQVKIRGFRIELEEIESHLLQNQAIQEVVVIDRENEKGEKYLYAYMVPKPGVNVVEASKLREYLSRFLPEYMIPSYFVTLEHIPLTPNNKVNRKALPEPEVKVGEKHLAPANEIEETLVTLWSDILSLPPEVISTDANFFELGGHSLKATIMAARINQIFNTNLPLVEIFTSPDIRGLAQYTKSASKTGYVSIEPAEKREYYRLSSAQKRLFILQQMELSSTVYNIPQTLTLDSEIDREILENTLKTLIKRHESLRTSFKIIKGEPIQGVHEEVDFEIEYYDLTTEAGGFIRPFDLSQAPLLRARLIKIEPRKHLFMADIHHIIGDGLSLERLIKEFMICYEGGESKLPPLRLQYKDYAQWQNSQVGTESLQRQEAYWLEEFAEPVTVLTIPTDFARPAIQSFEGSTLNFRINEKETQRLQALASVEGATLFMVLLAAFNVLIARLSGSENITIGTPIAGRRHAQLEPIIGMFVNTLALRNHPNQVKTFTHFLKEVKASTLEAFENQDYPFEELVEKIEVTRDAGRNPVFDIMFTFWSAQEQPTPSPEAGEIEQRIAKFDLILGVTQEGSHLSCGFDYCTKLFKPETIEKFARYFCKIVTAVVKNPGQKLLQIDLLSEEEKQQLLVDFNDTELPYPNDKTLPQLFARQAARTPDGIALIGTKAGNVFNVTYTYQQLNQETNQLAHYLLQQGAAQNELVGLLVDRTPEMIIGILGILKAGCGYVPLNPKGPESRLKYILEECSARLLLTLSHLMDKNHWFDNCIYIDEVTRYPDMAVTEAKTRILPDHLAYAIFTSGTTGKPKGVPIKHANLSPLLHWGYRHLGIGSSDRIIQNLSYYFDWSVWEIFITLTTGACLYMISDEVLLNPEESIDFIDKNKITVLHATPTQYRYYVSVGRKLETLKYLFIGAEKLTLELMRRSLTSVKETCRVFNMYGPTEATIIAAVLEIRRGEEENFVHLSSVPIGIPVGNTRLFVLDKHLQLCPLNVVGELYIGGEGVSPGYLNRPELTSVKFDQDLWDFRDYRDEEKNRTGKRIYSPTHPLTHSTMYRTGDLARWLSDGNVEFLGRLDLQVKIRGYRIELGEIESHLLKHSLVKEPVVLALEDEAKAEKYLCAYIIPIEKIIDSEQGAERLGRELKRYLSSVLPDYMVPSYFIPIEKIPLNPNGKIDMRALPKPGLIAGKQRLSPRDEIEEKLLEIWCDVLELDIEADKEVPFGIEDNFFELGGHSLRATAMVSRIKKELKITVPLVEVFTSPTIEQLARYIKEVQSGETTGESEITVVSDNLMLLGKDTADAPNLFFIHDGSGEVEGYMALCQHLHQPVNCWGIRAGQRESMAPQNLTVETLSQHYIQIIKGIQPRGPYALIGWSLGGTIAFEMARKLEETNETMGFFSIIDSLPPSRERAQKVTGASEAFSLESEKKWLKKHLPKGQLKEQLRRLKDMNTLWRTVGEHLESVDPGGDSIRALLPTNILQVIPHSTQLLVKQLIYYLNVIRTLERACALYIPKNNVKTKLHYFAAHQSEGIVDKKQWQDFCENKVKFYELQGDHFSILQNPNVSGIASLVEKIMKSGQGGHNAH